MIYLRKTSIKNYNPDKYMYMINCTFSGIFHVYFWKLGEDILQEVNESLHSLASGFHQDLMKLQ